MEQSAQSNREQLIDLTRTMEVAYWCRVFDVSADQLRDAVHHAGHQVAEVRRYLVTKAASAASGA
ncbi:hypothetical protein GCM10027034_11580 [Ramlibacter solisilvae]|uniref:DUF3606 domain-containing protein n=1 Tax=Ramlibacter tataouinensis TaxID=94132 RepID=A0A127JXA7_9BURK|nr:DUF3606 domain-containing protein [Ramlibacter tataouinensis]AMO24554.1 hypothetical protein UC35_19040 [Ramlibacter tataouinensis]